MKCGFLIFQNKTVLLHLEIAPRVIVDNDFTENNSETFNKILDTNKKFWGFNIGVAYLL